MTTQQHTSEADDRGAQPVCHKCNVRHGQHELVHLQAASIAGLPATGVSVVPPAPAVLPLITAEPLNPVQPVAFLSMFIVHAYTTSFCRQQPMTALYDSEWHPQGGHIRHLRSSFWG